MANSDFEGKDTQVLGISTDARATQTAFATTLGNVPYPVLTDFHPKGNVSRLYGVYNEQRGTANRSVIIIDKAGTVRFKHVYADMSELSVAEILAEVDSL